MNKESTRLTEAVKRAADTSIKFSGTGDLELAGSWSQTAALLEIARQIAITREESQNGKPSRFDQR